jgi:hypothetical protein
MTSGYIGLKELIIIIGELKSMHIIVIIFRWVWMMDLIRGINLSQCLRCRIERIRN